MSGGKLINHQTIVGWSNNHKNNKALAFETDSAGISLSELEDFIKNVRTKYPDFNGIRFSFVRYPLSADTDNIKLSGNNVSQPSIVLVPVKSFDPAKGIGDDSKVGTSEQVFALALADPGESDPGDTSILCPPRC
jgi:hypothetical protein